MKSTPSNISTSLQTVFLLIFLLSCFRPSHSQEYHHFIQCLDNWGISGLVYTRTNSSFLPILKASIDNRRFVSLTTPKPLVIVTPEHERDIRVVVLCSKQNKIQIRTRSGGHDFEGLSYRSLKVDPFVIIDLFKLNKITIDVSQQTAWVQAGATLGQLYYEISKVSPTLAFPGGFCPTVGVGGHFSGGGFGQLFRKYGLAADNVIDARLIDVHGNVVNRDYMAEDLFWAIRGGGGGSFGVVASWRVKLVDVPQIVTMFTINRTLDQNATELVHKWQSVAPKFPNDIYFAVDLRSESSGESGNKTILATFVSIFNGRVGQFLELFAQRFPELNVNLDDCTEASWIQSLLLFNGYDADESPEVLANRNPPIERFAYKRKADYVFEPISESGLQGIWNLLHEAETADVLLIANGGIMNEIPESALPFPHRAGHLYEVLTTVKWHEADTETSQYISWIRELYRYMTPYVSKSPRAAYVNYRDLDLGVNNGGNINYAQIPTWMFQYFKNNVYRLMIVKSIVDPTNFFRHEQSVPTIPLDGEKMEGSSDVLKAIS